MDVPLPKATISSCYVCLIAVLSLVSTVIYRKVRSVYVSGLSVAPNSDIVVENRDEVIESPAESKRSHV
jgi:hypothetical protein